MTVSADYDVGPGLHRAVNYCIVVRIGCHDLMFPRRVDNARVNRRSIAALMMLPGTPPKTVPETSTFVSSVAITIVFSSQLDRRAFSARRTRLIKYRSRRWRTAIFPILVDGSRTSLQ